MTHRNYLAGMTPTHFRGLPFDVWNTLIAEVGCSFRFVVLNATVFDCHIFDRPLSTQFLAISKSHLINLVKMKCSLHSRHFTSTQDWFHDRPLLNLYSVIVLVPGTNPQTVIRNRRIESLFSTLLVHMGFTLHCTSSGMEQLVAHPVTTVSLFFPFTAPLSQIPSFSQNRLEAVEQRHLHCFCLPDLSRPRWCPNHKAGNPPDSLNDSAENVAEEGGRGGRL
ncbi:hypothetical protein BLNAU_24733 [Blattamonas nauphoetae]|uniref:Uncharacterized protein n=1 Tax=Blattamonas nauphoetae TaxID=2049346 RepID=A0ABQ9WPG8_9EUKA|nr:hypothetical protein BLNAU_24733 [Blattamonas nauphoetae]